MEDYEVDDIIENLAYTDRQMWEATRQQIYTYVQINSKRKLKPKDVMKFLWDDDTRKIPQTKIETEDINRLSKRAEEIKKQLCKSK